VIHDGPLLTAGETRARFSRFQRSMHQQDVTREIYNSQMALSNIPEKSKLSKNSLFYLQYIENVAVRD
jgi:hypothetical protein